MAEIESAHHQDEELDDEETLPVQRRKSRLGRKGSVFLVLAGLAAVIARRRSKRFRSLCSEISEHSSGFLQWAGEYFLEGIQDHLSTKIFCLVVSFVMSFLPTRHTRLLEWLVD
uniref:Uncharacterized protein n=1 Tax=Guillardia theta TaxID=55529 RepID=A0A6U6C6C5_GUITH|mmetsp:Transcript_42502/g.133877  ORF Transcript_42502/g.133877 Transcript_42502/m.133877 type:complete len:114 (+) Transcript_42502:17-358(+)